MSDDVPTGVLGLGYEGLDLEQFVKKLQAWDTVLLADVRLNPISRKRGFARKSLESALNLAGVDYAHFRALGNPQDNREGYGTDADGSRDRFRARLDDEDAKSALSEIAARARVGRVVVMCYEESELRCHRHEVLAALRPMLET